MAQQADFIAHRAISLSNIFLKIKNQRIVSNYSSANLLDPIKLKINFLPINHNKQIKYFLPGQQ